MHSAIILYCYTIDFINKSEMTTISLLFMDLYDQIIWFIFPA